VQEILICWIAHSEREYMNLSSLVKHGINLSVRAVLHALASRGLGIVLGSGLWRGSVMLKIYAAPLKKVGRRRALEGLRVPLWSVLSFAYSAPGFSVVKWQFCYRSLLSAHASLVMLFDHSKLRMI